MKNNRREFIKLTGLAGLAVSTKPIQTAFNEMISEKTMEKEMLFISPVDGDMLNEYDGIISGSSLLTKVKVSAAPDRNLKINGIEAKYEDGYFMAAVPLKDYKNVIEAIDLRSGEKQNIIVFWLKNIVNKYRLSIDDNIWFLKDISTNAGNYKSIFKNPYLGFLKEVHDTYGTKIHLNLFYQTEGFNLSQMTVKYKNEWKENAGWLRLSFHSLQEFPDRPYIHAGYNEVKKDCEMVMEQIRRFAGDELLGPVMTLHWGETTAEGCRALKDSGYSGLAGYFSYDGPDTVSYYLDEQKRRHINNRFIWRDNSEGIIFSRMALVINTLKSDQILPYLNNLRSDSHKPAYIDLMIHEQYFHPFYINYQPDFRQKVITSIKWAADNGYKPAFLDECIFG
jgi:hypothetical protein